MDPNPYESPRNSQPMQAISEFVPASTVFRQSSDKGILRTVGLWICYTNLALFCVWAVIVSTYLAQGFELLPVLQKNDVLGTCGGLLILGSMLGLLVFALGLVVDTLRRRC